MPIYERTCAAPAAHSYGDARKCAAPFTATRKDAKFCSAACRKRVHRATPGAQRADQVRRLKASIERHDGHAAYHARHAERDRAALASLLQEAAA